MAERLILPVYTKSTKFGPYKSYFVEFDDGSQFNFSHNLVNERYDPNATLVMEELIIPGIGDVLAPDATDKYPLLAQFEESQGEQLY